jgi:precorrin-6A/cobalt-precorrin-6A reductase
MATDIPSGMKEGARLQMRSGPLDEKEMAALIAERSITAIVDATHPYAREISRKALSAAAGAGIPYLRFSRPETALPGTALIAEDHETAARLAFTFGKPVLLTIGSRNIGPYAEESQRMELPLSVRVLPHKDALNACAAQGIAGERIISGRGPFSVEENVDAIRRFGIGVVVTKNSGDAGGVPEKIEAVTREGCRIIVVKRPGNHGIAENAFSLIDDLIAAVKTLTSK